MREAKSLLRRAARQTLASLGPEERAAASAEICRRLQSRPEWERSRMVGLYAAQPAEPDLRALTTAAGKVFCYPRVEGSELRFYTGDFPTVAVPPWGLLEPEPGVPVEPAEIDLLLVPGLAFDRAGGRLGRGAGFYDRCLAQLAARAIGVCFHAQLVAEIPREAHDRPVHAVVTEREFCEATEGEDYDYE